MSGQSNQRVRRMASPSTKQGPLKATQTFGLVQGSPTRTPTCRSKNSSPSSSPTIESHRVKSRRSPDNRASPDRASPSSPGFKVERPKPIRLSPSPSGIKRTGSLDTIAGPYLTGQWPRDILVPAFAASTTTHTYDKATQTEVTRWSLYTTATQCEMGDLAEEGSNGDKKKKNHKRSASLGNGDTLKELLKSRLKTKDGNRTGSSGTQRTSPGPHLESSRVSYNARETSFLSPQGTSAFTSKSVAIPHIAKPSSIRARGSVEGLNQEIERVLSISCIEEDRRIYSQETPDGHRAPVLELLHMAGTRSIDTQTPSAFLDDKISEESNSRSSSNGSSSGESRAMSESPSFPVIVACESSSRSSSRSDSGAEGEGITISAKIHEETSTSRADEDFLLLREKLRQIGDIAEEEETGDSSTHYKAEATQDIDPVCVEKETQGSELGKDTNLPKTVPFLQKEEQSPTVLHKENTKTKVESPPRTVWMRVGGSKDITDVSRELERLEIECESPRFAPSPKPNKSFMFTRGPPDGAEVKIIEEARRLPPMKEPLLYCPVMKPSAFRIPSVDSAFCPLKSEVYPDFSSADFVSLKVPSTSATTASPTMDA